MELKDAIAKRYSVRSYLDKKVDKELVKEILEVSKEHLQALIRSLGKYMLLWAIQKMSL